MSAFELSDVLAVSRRERLRAIRAIEIVDDATAFALRRLLFTDDDAHVRAAAARTLGTFDGAERWLLDAIRDRAPLVRDTVLRALARCGGEPSCSKIRAIVETDGIWWVRRSAVYALAAVGGEAEVPAFTRALGDPFWRVRHAAVRVLAVLGAQHPEVRLEMQDAPPSSTLAFLRGTWGPVAVEAPARANAPSLLPPALLDPDPAVVTARIADDPDVTPLALVELLCDPHATLREAASKRLAKSGNLDAFEAALDWLEEPRIPQVGDTVIALLDGLGDPALEIARRALARTARPAATRWAIEWIVAAQAETLYDAVLARVSLDATPAVRRAAVTLAEDTNLVAWAADGNVTDAVAVELHARRSWDALISLDAVDHPRTRALQVDASARRKDPNHPFVRASIADSHPGPRAIAARWLARKRLTPLAELLIDGDPTVREAALSAIRIDHASPRTDSTVLDAEVAAIIAAVSDRDPWVRRAAIQALVTLSPALEVPTSAGRAFTDPDAGVRRIACELPTLPFLARVVAATFDANDGVRASASDALDRLADSDQRVHALLDGDLDQLTRTAAYAWLTRRLDDAAVELARTARETDPRVRSLLDAVIASPTGTRAIVVDEPPAPEPLVIPTPAITERRTFGRAGFSVAPLAISGAFDLPVEGLEQAVAAGVDLLFWEPGYDLLGRFLRKRPQLRVMTGTYHADAKSIRADVDRALKTLGRETLDVFLLFWTRSPARVDAAAYACLDALRRQGKIRAIGFSTHHRDLARDAITARDWDVVMIRHSAAHPGIESELLPVARERGTAIVTFSALTYGRMTSGAGAPSPAECYRYSLAQPGVTACISAPRRIEELAHNLEALANPSMTDERIAELRTFGIGVRAESQRFNTLLRQPTRDAAAAAREMLASEAPPDELRAPAPTAPRRSRTRLGGRRRR